MKEKKEKFNFKKFLKDYKYNWIFLEHYNDTLKLHNEGILFIKDFKCINDRLAEVNGTFIQRMTFDNGNCSIINNEKDTTFILAQINIEIFNKIIISEELAKETIKKILP